MPDVFRCPKRQDLPKRNAQAWRPRRCSAQKPHDVLRKTHRTPRAMPFVCAKCSSKTHTRLHKTRLAQDTRTKVIGTSRRRRRGSQVMRIVATAVSRGRPALEKHEPVLRAPPLQNCRSSNSVRHRLVCWPYIVAKKPAHGSLGFLLSAASTTMTQRPLAFAQINIFGTPTG